jgi:hypothetical protein
VSGEHDQHPRFEVPAPSPFPVGVEVQYTGPDERTDDGTDRLTALDHGIVGLVGANHPGVPGRAPGTLGADDRGFETVHGYSVIAYLAALLVRVAYQAGRGARSVDHFWNLEPEGVPAEVAEQRLRAHKAEQAPSADIELVAEP